MSKAYVAGLVIGAVLVVASVAGFGMNIVKAVTVCDWSADTSWKCEVVRSVGVLAPPVGAVVGYVDLGT